MRWIAAFLLMCLAPDPVEAGSPRVLESHLADRSFLVEGWDSASLEQRHRLAASLFAGLDDDSHWDPWIHLHSWDRKLGQFDGRVVVLFLDPDTSATDRVLLIQSNTPIAVAREARIVEMPAVNYPEEARTTDLEGDAGVRCRVDAHGSMDLILALPHDGDQVLVGAAVDALRQARFAAAEGATGSTWIRVPFRFVLEGEIAVR